MRSTVDRADLAVLVESDKGTTFALTCDDEQAL